MSLEIENKLLKDRIKALEKEIEFLKTHSSIAQGMKGESLIVKLTGGKIGSYADSHDILVGNNVKVEVKFSKLNSPVEGSKTKRWNWSKPLGWKDKGKIYQPADKVPLFSGTLSF